MRELSYWIDDGLNLLINSSSRIENLLNQLVHVYNERNISVISNVGFTYDNIDFISNRDFDDLVKYFTTINKMILKPFNSDVTTILNYNGLFICFTEHFNATCDVTISMYSIDSDLALNDILEETDSLIVDLDYVKNYYISYFNNNEFNRDFYFDVFMR